MAETDYAPIYGNADPALRPSLVSRQSGAGWRAPGFIGRSLAGAQPQTAPSQGAQSSGDAMAAMRGLYASRAGDDFTGDNSAGVVGGGQQPTRETQSFSDLMASAAMGALALSGPVGMGAYMMGQDRLPNQSGPVSWDSVKSAMNPFSTGNSVIGRGLSAAYNSVIGSGPAEVPSGFDRQTGMAPGERSLGIDRSVTSEPLAPLGTGGEAAPIGGSFDPTTGMAPGERDLGIDRSVQSSEIGPIGGDAPAPQGPEQLRTGGFVGKPGSKPVPQIIAAHTGEAVMRPEAVNKYGPSAMSAINAMRAPVAAVKAATKAAPPAKKSPPSKGKMPEKKGGTAMDALARMKARG